MVQDFGNLSIQRFGGSGFRLQIWELPQIRGTCLGVRILRIIIC